MRNSIHVQGSWYEVAALATCNKNKFIFSLIYIGNCEKPAVRPVIDR